MYDLLFVIVIGALALAMIALGIDLSRIIAIGVLVLLALYAMLAAHRWLTYDHDKRERRD